MSKELTTIASREDFIKFIDSRLNELGFNKDQEKELWIYEKDIQGAARTIIINNQRMDQPGESHHVKFAVNVYGEGEMKDVESEKVDSFVQIDFNVYQDEQDVSSYPTFCVFYDDQILFNSLLNKIFGL